MVVFLAALGYDPGPTQRPLTAGAISATVATIPAVPVLIHFGSLKVEAAILGISAATTLIAGIAAMAVAGAIYARLFGRAANSTHGGWLFGMAFGFCVWAGGAVMILPAVSGGLMPAGAAAAGVFLSLLLWGFATGVVLPLVQPHLHQTLRAGSRRKEVGPIAATTKDSHDRGTPHKRPQ